VQLWLVLIFGLLALGAILLFGALRVEIDARGFGEPDGAWALAFGVDAGAFALAGVLGSATPPRIELLTLGRRFRLPSSKREKKPRPRRKSAPGNRVQRQSNRIWRSISASDLIELVFADRRRLSVEVLDVDVAYGFKDIVLTGKLTGALYALAGALSGRVRVTQRPRWDGAERFELSLHGTLSIWVGRVLAELAWFMLRARSRSEPVSDSKPLSAEQAEVPR
jgi:hypothetical protein